MVQIKKLYYTGLETAVQIEPQAEPKKEKRLEFQHRGFKCQKPFGWQETIEIRSELGVAQVFKFDGEWQASLCGIYFKSNPKKVWMLKELLLEIKRVLDDPDAAYKMAAKAHSENPDRSLRSAQDLQARLRQDTSSSLGEA